MQRAKPGASRSCCGMSCFIFRKVEAPGGGGGLVHEVSCLCPSPLSSQEWAQLTGTPRKTTLPACIPPYPTPMARTLKFWSSKAFRNGVRKTIGDAFLKAQLMSIFIWIELEQPGETDRVCQCPVTPVPGVSTSVGDEISLAEERHFSNLAAVCLRMW